MDEENGWTTAIEEYEREMSNKDFGIALTNEGFKSSGYYYNFNTTSNYIRASNNISTSPGKTRPGTTG